jgi:hypothetical protein
MTNAKDAAQKNPEGTTTPQGLFDLNPGKPAGKPAAKKAPASPAKKAAAGWEKDKKPAEVYPEGTEIHYVGDTTREKTQLPNKMTAKEVYEYMQDDYPEVTEDRVELRYDKARGRIVMTPKSFKKGAALAARVSGGPWRR